jgi:pyridoxine kinase
MASVICLSSHVGYGAVGNRIMVPALEALGHSVAALSTLQLPWHPGMNGRFGQGTRLVPGDHDFAALMDDFCNAPWLGQCDAILTGYLGSAAQAGAIAKLVAALKRANPDALYLCDPVIGDTHKAAGGGLYVTEAVATAVRDYLWPLADIVTPNLFEFGWMTGQTSQELPIIAKAAKALNKQYVVVTSVGAEPDTIGNFLISNDQSILQPVLQSTLISHEALSPTPNGTGDMLAALFLGHIMKKNLAPKDALAKAVCAVAAAIKHANANHQSSLAPEQLRGLTGTGEAVETTIIE